MKPIIPALGCLRRYTTEFPANELGKQYDAITNFVWVADFLAHLVFKLVSAMVSISDLSLIEKSS